MVTALGAARRLEGLFHPLVIKEREHALEDATMPGERSVVRHAPASIEPGIDRLCGGAVLVAVPRKARPEWERRHRAAGASGRRGVVSSWWPRVCVAWSGGG